MRTKIIVLSCLSFLSLHLIYAQCISASENAMHPAIVSLTGHFVTEKDWGGPNFGESPKTDSQFQSVLLKLDHPITQCGNTHDQEKTLDCVQIFPLDCGAIPDSMLYGQHVTVSGILDTASSPYQITPIIMECRKIKTHGVDLNAQEEKDLKLYRCKSSGGGIQSPLLHTSL